MEKIRAVAAVPGQLKVCRNENLESISWLAGRARQGET